MLKRWGVIVGAMLVAVVGLSAYFTWRVPPGVEPMGETSDTVAWVALATSIVSLLTALTGMAQKLIELRKG